MKVQRLFAVGLVSGSLALSALVGTAAVGAADVDNTVDRIAAPVPAASVQAVTSVPTEQATQQVIVSPVNTPNDGRDDAQ